MILRCSRALLKSSQRARRNGLPPTSRDILLIAGRLVSSLHSVLSLRLEVLECGSYSLRRVDSMSRRCGRTVWRRDVVSSRHRGGHVNRRKLRVIVSGEMLQVIVSTLRLRVFVSRRSQHTLVVLVERECP